MAAKGLVKFRADKCKGCELCLSVCPKKIITMSRTEVNSMGYHPAEIVDMEGCAACANCALMCPDGAVSVYKEKDGGRG